MYKIIETEDYYPLSLLFHNSGLEVAIASEPPESTIKMWRCESDDGTLLAAAAIEKRSGLLVLGGLAVVEDMRGKGLGKELLALAEKEAQTLQEDTFWLVGKVPDFYKKFGWEEVPREGAPEISKCMRCGQFGESCFPSVMKKTL